MKLFVYKNPYDNSFSQILIQFGRIFSQSFFDDINLTHCDLRTGSYS